MESTSSHEAGLMAAWRATGGASDAMRETAAEDEGMAAFGISRSVLYCGDDGLAATQYSDPYRCNIDDGLVARAPSFGGNDCRADDGLEAGGHYTSFGCLLNDDGLQATGPTQSWNRCF